MLVYVLLLCCLNNRRVCLLLKGLYGFFLCVIGFELVGMAWDVM